MWRQLEALPPHQGVPLDFGLRRYEGVQPEMVEATADPLHLTQQVRAIPIESGPEVALVQHMAIYTNVSGHIGRLWNNRRDKKTLAGEMAARPN